MRWRYTEEGKRKLSENRKGKPSWKRTAQSRSNLSLSLKGRVFSEEHRKKLSIAKIGMACPWAIGNTNMLGKKQSKSSKKKVSLSKIGIPRSLETRRKVSIGLSRGIMEGRIRIHNTKRIRYQGVLFRSGWEILFAKTLTRLGILWKYEQLLIIPSGGYLPDFFLPEYQFYIEIKGYWRDDALRKFLEASKIYPIKLIMEEEMKNLGILKNSTPLEKEEFLDRLGGELTRNPEKEEVCA